MWKTLHFCSIQICMKTIIGLVLVALCSVACKEKNMVCIETELVNPKLVLLVGQSNTHAGLGLDENLDAPVDGIYQLGRFDNNNCIIQACEPLDNHTKTEGRIGFAFTFTKQLQGYLQGTDDIIIIPCGYGGTGFIDGNWNKTDPLYEDAIARTDHVLAAYPNAELTAILWHQGETDVVLNNPDYQSSLDQFIQDMRTDLGAPEVPFIVGGMVPYWVNQAPERQAVQNILKDTPQRHVNAGYADPDLPFVIAKSDNTFDEIHFDAAGQRELGNRYFAEYLEIVE